MSGTKKRRTAGVLVMEHIAAAVVEDGKVVSGVSVYPEGGGSVDALLTMPADALAGKVCELVKPLIGANAVAAVGVGFPGLIREGIVEESPNLQQMKGFNLQGAIEAGLGGVPVRVYNDADATVAGIAAGRGAQNRLSRVWTLGNGVGFGRYPWSEGVWEGGHSVVTTDPKEKFCGCGGRGHLEGVLGFRAMRLRFLDLEPEEVFANAKTGDERCVEFVKMCHRALAAATATSIHMEGPGPFYLTGPNARFLDVALLDRLVHEMVKMSPLQGTRIEVIPPSDELGIVGAAVNAELSTRAV